MSEFQDPWWVRALYLRPTHSVFDWASTFEEMDVLYNLMQILADGLSADEVLAERTARSD